MITQTREPRRRNSLDSGVDLFAAVREAIQNAPHQWHHLVGLDTELLSRTPGTPCPFCCSGEGEDRLHKTSSFDTDGAVRCRHGDRVYDAIDALVASDKATSKLEAAQMLADLYGVPYSTSASRSEKLNGKPDDFYAPTIADYDSAPARSWCSRKGITEESFRAAGGEIVRYKNKLFIGVPGFAPDSDYSRPVRWILFDPAGELIETRNGAAKNICVLAQPGAPKALLSLDGLRNLATAEIVVKVEGPTDLMRLWDAIPVEERQRCIVISNANGCTENPSPETLAHLASKPEIWVVGDADMPGQKGAEKWARSLKNDANRVKIIRLPFEDSETHGKDLRDFFNEGYDFSDFLELEQLDVAPPAAAVVASSPNSSPSSEQDEEEINYVEPGQRCPSSGRLILDPDRTESTADAFIRELYTVDDVPILRHVDGQFYHWTDNHYMEICDDEIASGLLPWLSQAFTQTVYSNKNGKTTVSHKPHPAKAATVKATREVVVMRSFLRSPETFPAWIGPGEPPCPDPSQLIFGKTKNLYIPTMESFEPTPLWFNRGRLDFDYDATRRDAPHWFEFLCSMFPNDLQSMDVLMEMIGLLVSPITKFQKMFAIIGPPRSGKGTIARIIRKLVGELNYCGPTTDSLTDPFGLQPLLGKSVAIVSDARFNSRNISTLTERLLAITGEDTLTVHRKHKEAVNIQLPTRFVFLTNEIPRLTDASGAIASRLVLIKLSKSFYGQEDLELEAKLTEELPAILYLALRSLRDLLNRGYFVQPDTAKDDLEMLKDLGSPIKAFIRDYCELVPSAWTLNDDLWAAWQEWCEDEGRDCVGTKSTFFRNLVAALPEIKKIRRSETMNSRQFYAYEGIRLLR